MSVAKAEILDAISNMSVLELSQLIKDLEDKFGVSAAAATVAAAAPAGESGTSAPRRPPTPDRERSRPKRLRGEEPFARVAWFAGTWLRPPPGRRRVCGSRG